MNGGLNTDFRRLDPLADESVAVNAMTFQALQTDEPRIEVAFVYGQTAQASTIGVESAIVLRDALNAWIAAKAESGTVTIGVDIDEESGDSFMETETE